MHYITVALVFLASVSACNKQIVNDSNDKWEPEKIETTDLTKAEADINKASNSFGFNIYHELCGEREMLVSPLSLSLALSMAATGAEGSTAQQMRSALGFSDFSKEDINSYYQKMVYALLNIDEDTVFEVANSIWASNRLSVKDRFIKEAKGYYSSDVKTVDFSLQSTVQAINSWCVEKTHGKIGGIMDRPAPSLRMALINALYFNGTWAFDFDEEIKEEEFSALDGKTTTAEMMHHLGDLQYGEYDGFRMVSLPYGNGAFKMKVVLPSEDEDFLDALRRLDSETWAELDNNSSKQKVNLKLPRFKFEYMTGLVGALQSLGMVDAFGDRADFSGISDSFINIGSIMQKTYIDVNEKGTEAAAVTFIGITTTSVGSKTPKIIDFFADRPFFFTIEESNTGAILFMGQKVS